MKTSHTNLFRSFICAALLGAGLWLSLASVPVAQANLDNQRPTLPSPSCDNLKVPSGNGGGFHVYAKGVQIYRWNGASWSFVAPDARLFADPYYQAEIGIHYAGPYWESYTGSKVKGSRVEGCPSPDPTAVDWLLLRAVETAGPGVLSSVTYIQRVNTTGGKAPATPGSSVGEVINVPYAAVYYFYRAED